MKVVKRLLQSIQSRGLFGTLRWLYYGYVVPNKFLVFYRNLEATFDYSSMYDGMTIKRLSLDQLKDIRDRKSGYPIEFYCDETEGFSTPFVAYVNNEVAAIHWLVLPGEKSRFLDMKEGDVELNYNTVLPEFRGNKLAAPLMAYIIDRCKQEGQRRMFGVVHVDNLPQYKQMIRLGFEPVEILSHFGPFRPKATLKYVK